VLIYKDLYNQLLKDNHGDKEYAAMSARAILTNVYGSMELYEEKYNEYDWAAHDKENKKLTKKEQYDRDLQIVKQLQSFQPDANWTYKKYKKSLGEDLYKKPIWEEEEEIVGYDEEEEIDDNDEEDADYEDEEDEEE
jgi:hypothetical protein